MRGIQAYIATASLVGGAFGGFHGHLYRKNRMGEGLRPTLAVTGVVRDVFVGAVVTPILFPFLSVTAMFPTMNRCIFPKRP